jgi:hypothetical protein
MAKLQFFKLFGNTGAYLSTKQIERLLLLAFGISQSKSVNISYVNDHILPSESGCKNEESQYNNLLKVFQTGNYENIIRNSFHLVVIYFYGGQERVQLVVDRTNWELGKEKINILTIGLLAENDIFIPLIWIDLGHKGNSNSNQRIDLIDRLLAWWKALGIPVPTFEICGDREFIGEYWLTALAQRGISYVIRLRSDLSFETWLNGEYKVEKRFGIRTLHRYMVLFKKPSVEVILQNEAIAQVFVVKNEGNDVKKEPFIYFITNLDNLDEAALAYRKRWKIEVFFKYMKTQGFNLEDFNMSGQHKTDILMAVLALVFLTVLELEAENKVPLETDKANQEEIIEKSVKTKEKPIIYKNGKSSPRKSIFRKGMSAITKIRCFETFFDVCKRILEKILHKFIFLNDLYINKKYVQ